MFYVKSCLGPFNGKKYCFKIDGDDNDDLDDDDDFVTLDDTRNHSTIYCWKNQVEGYTDV